MKAYEQGFKANQNGDPVEANPYERSQDARKWGDWQDGWLDSERSPEDGLCDPRSEKSSLKACG
jgi:ribosome modulation factor